MPWVPRGLREGIVTTRYPRRPDGYGADFKGSVIVDPERAGVELDRVAEACPTSAISRIGGRARLDLGRCILCGRCVELFPEAFSFDPGLETSVLGRRQLVVPPGDEDDAALEAARTELGLRTKALRRSVHIRHVDAGSDGADEWEVAALTNPIYDVQRLGVYFTASPRHADLLLVTGVGAAGMLDPLIRTFEAMPEPKVVIAAGVDALSGGLMGEGYVARGGVAPAIPVDVFIPGSPATPFGLLHGILLAIGLLSSSGRRNPHGSRASSNEVADGLVADPREAGR